MTINLKQKAIKGIVWSFLDKIVNQAGSFALLVYLSRVLSPSDFGLIAMLAIFLAVSQSLIDSGFSQALIQRSHKATEQDFCTVFYVNLLISFALYGSLAISAPFIADFYQQPELVNLSRILFTVVIINAVAIVPRSKLIIAVDFKTQSIINSVAMIVSAIIAIYMVSNDYGYWSLVALSLAKSITSAVLLLLYSGWLPKYAFSFSSFKALFAFGSNLLVAGLIATIVQNLNSVLIGRKYNAEQLGYFQQAFNYTNIMATTLSMAIQGVTYPIMTSIQEEKERLVNAFVKVMGVVALVTFPVFIGFAAIAEEFVILFLGEKWQPITPILIALCFARLITPISGLNLNILKARGRSDLYLKADLSKLPFTIAAVFTAVQFGVLAVAIAQILTAFISFLINTYYPGKLFNFGARKQLKQLLPIALASLVMFLGIYFIEFENILIQMLVKITLGAFIYIAACKILKVTSLNEVSNLLFKRIDNT